MKRLLAAGLLCVLAFSLSGCFLEPAESLYAVPRQPESFYDLQSAIEKQMGDGVSYSPPTAGENQQAVQLTDLDGDLEDEAIVFLKTQTDTPMTVCVFDRKDGTFSLLTRISGAGTAFDRVEYVQIDDRPGKEIVLGRQISEHVTQALNVYALKDGTLVELLSASYSDFITTGMGVQGRSGIFLLHQDATAANGIAEYYHWSDGALLREREAEMSAPVSAVKRIITGRMCQDVPAVFVASSYGESAIVTDIFGFRDGGFTNFIRTDETDTEVKTVRDYYVYSADIDIDGLIELPRLQPMKAIAGDDGSKNQSLICWYNLNADASETRKKLTYHNYIGGWYLEIPEAWSPHLAVTQTDAYASAPAYRFLFTSANGKTEELFTIVATTEASARSGWSVLKQQGDMNYLCQLGDGAQQQGVTVETLRSAFRLIRVDWKTGETG